MDKNERSGLCKDTNLRGHYGSICLQNDSCPSERLGARGQEVGDKCRAGANINNPEYDVAVGVVVAEGNTGSAGSGNIIQSSSDSLIWENGESKLLKRAAARVPCLGIIFALLASIFLGSAGMLVKMTHSVHGVQVAVFRATIQAAIYATIIVLRKLPWRPPRSELKGVVGRALFGASSITFSYNALKLISLSDATTIRFSMPIWTLIIGYLMLNENFDLVHLVAVVACISGVLMIAKPDMVLHFLSLIYSCLAGQATLAPQLTNASELLNSRRDMRPLASELTHDDIPYGLQPILLLADELGPQSVMMNTTTETLMSASSKHQEGHQQLEGTLLALSSSICLAISLVCLRLCKETKVEITILWLSLASVAIGSGLLVSINEWRFPDNWLDVLFILLNGLFGSIGQWFITNALKIEQSGVISLTRTADIQVAFFYGAFLLDEPIKATSILGSLLVTLGVVVVALPKLLAQGSGRWCWCCCCCSSGATRNWTSGRQSSPAADIEVPRQTDHLGDIPSIGDGKPKIPAEVLARGNLEGVKECGKQLAVFVA